MQSQSVKLYVMCFLSHTDVDMCLLTWRYIGHFSPVSYINQIPKHYVTELTATSDYKNTNINHENSTVLPESV